jgi:hypothetical protein
MKNYYAGDKGSIFYQNVALADIREWSIASAQSVVESTTLGDSATRFRYSRPAYSGSLRVLANDTPDGDLALLTEELMRTDISPAPAIYTLILVAGQNRIRCKVLFSEIEYGSTPGDATEANLAFVVDGLLDEYSWTGIQLGLTTAALQIGYQPIAFRYYAISPATSAIVISRKDISFGYYQLSLTTAAFVLDLKNLDFELV